MYALFTALCAVIGMLVVLAVIILIERHLAKRGTLSKTALSKNTCGDCRYYVSVYECRRHSPTTVKEGQRIWPYVGTQDFCGDWEPSK